MTSGSGIEEMMRMTVIRFYDTWQAIRAVCERRTEARKKSAEKAPKPRKAKQRR